MSQSSRPVPCGYHVAQAFKLLPRPRARAVYLKFNYPDFDCPMTSGRRQVSLCTRASVPERVDISPHPCYFHTRLLIDLLSPILRTHRRRRVGPIVGWIIDPGHAVICKTENGKLSL